MSHHNHAPNPTGAGGFKPGVSGNPGGRPKLPEEIKLMKNAALHKAIEILHEKIMDKDYMDSLNASDLIRFMETTFDRFGLPKVTKQEISGDDGSPLIIKWEDNASN